jgi:DNA-binding NarL/FixJ family response regulator
MLGSGAILERPISVALVDDNDTDLARAEERVCDAFGEPRIIRATSYDELVSVVSREQKDGNPIDIASIDWRYGQTEAGARILKYLKQTCPDAARIVYTNIEERRIEATREGADAYIVKGDGPAVYRDGLGQAVRVTARRSLSRLLPELGPAKGDAAESEQAWRKTVRQRALEARVRDGGESEIHLHLRRYGAWGELDSEDFVKERWFRKLSILLNAVGADGQEFARYLDAAPAVAIEILERGAAPEHAPPQVSESADRLLSVLGFVMRLAGYEPLVMAALWTAEREFAENLVRPPWFGVGLQRYLRDHRRVGIRESLEWIRES